VRKAPILKCFKKPANIGHKQLFSKNSRFMKYRVKRAVGLNCELFCDLMIAVLCNCEWRWMREDFRPGHASRVLTIKRNSHQANQT
jgi:hypothetical protein